MTTWGNAGHERQLLPQSVTSLLTPAPVLPPKAFAYPEPLQPGHSASPQLTRKAPWQVGDPWGPPCDVMTDENLSGDRNTWRPTVIKPRGGCSPDGPAGSLRQLLLGTLCMRHVVPGVGGSCRWSSLLCEPRRELSTPHTAASVGKLTGPQIQCKANCVSSFQMLLLAICASIRMHWRRDGHGPRPHELTVQGESVTFPMTSTVVSVPHPSQGTPVHRSSKPSTGL